MYVAVMADEFITWKEKQNRTIESQEEHEGITSKFFM